MTTINLSPPQLADIERQKSDWPICGTCRGSSTEWLPLTASPLPGAVEYGRACPDCINGRIQHPLYIVGEGVLNHVLGPHTYHPVDASTCPYCSVRTPPAGWPAVGERVKCETCHGSGVEGYPSASRSDVDDCPDCDGEGSTLPRVELTVTCPHGCDGGWLPWGNDQRYADEPFVQPCGCGDGTVPWGSALWQTLPVVSEHVNDPPNHPYVEVTDQGLVILHFVQFDAQSLRNLPLDPASVRPGSFVGVLTDLRLA